MELAACRLSAHELATRIVAQASSDAMPDFRWPIENIVIDGEQVAVRLIDTGTPTRDWLGLKPTGRLVRFGENVFDRFRDGRIDEVWSIFDALAVRAQLGRSETGVSP